MCNEVFCDVDHFEIELILYPQKILNRKVNLTYHYFIDKLRKEKILYYIDNRKMIITCKLNFGIETILMIIEQLLRILEIINKYSMDGKFYIVDKNKNKYEISLKLGRKYNIYGLWNLTSPTTIDVNFEKENIITSTIEEVDLLKVYKIFEEMVQ